MSYYRDVAGAVLPYLKRRPVTLKRYPDGVAGGFFYEKRCPPHRPEWIRTIPMRRQKDNKDVEYCVVDNVAALVWAANLGNLELHATLAENPISSGLWQWCSTWTPAPLLASSSVPRSPSACATTSASSAWRRCARHRVPRGCRCISP